LEVLIFLKEMGIPYPHLHCGNIMLSIDEKELLYVLLLNFYQYHLSIIIALVK